MRDGSPQTIYRKDYQAPDFRINAVSMYVSIFEGRTEVTTDLQIERVGKSTVPLILDGEKLQLRTLHIDGSPIDEEHYEITPETLCVHNVPDAFLLRTVVEIAPEDNTSLEGLYRSRTMYCTQCEAEGFRKITYFLDRPDVLSLFTVTVEADKATCPVLLSNGNLTATEDLPQGRHKAVWHDPFPKPSYLFALVAGDLACVEDSFTTCSGKQVALRIFVEEKDRLYCDHAMNALKRSMRWDEEVYGLEYDLDLFNIVAVDDFNMGAMENKSLNIFNTSAVLAHPNITTDLGYQRIEAIVAHEYFHNYSGNRVTCRDWFQLSLKEGFTVFRDSEFSADMNSRGVKRVEDVAFLRTHQFAEDAGPMAHPVRPDSFIEISNFYTLTVYEKGAEIVRMLHTLLGHDTFIKGAQWYFQEFDGQAVTCDDFVRAMEQVSGRDLSQFRRWYEQAGTPQIEFSEQYDEASAHYRLTLKQKTPDTPGQINKPPLHIPVAVGLLVEGVPLALDPSGSTTRVLELTEAEQSFEFTGVSARPVPSLLRNFSAPVRMINEPDATGLLTLMTGDDDAFVRWDAAQTYAAQVIEQFDEQGVPDAFLNAYRDIMRADIDPAIKAHTLRLPSEDYLADRASQAGLIDVFAIHRRREQVRQYLAKHLHDDWRRLFEEHTSREPYAPSGAQIGVRSLRLLALAMLCLQGDQGLEAARNVLAQADNLTDRLAALRCIVDRGSASERQRVLDDFIAQWSEESLVVNHWLMLQATRPSPDTVEDVLALSGHTLFDWRNPNKMRSLIGAFANSNTLAFHRQDGAGYRLLADAVLRIQSSNPQVASRMLTPLTRYARYAQGSTLMRAELERIAQVDGLSKDVFEVVERSLAR
jgi:aminopeptidase N